VNAQVLTAQVVLTTMSSTNIVTPQVTVGVHDLASTLLSGGCLWTPSATWLFYSGSSNWTVCDGDNSLGQEGWINSTTLDSVAFSSAINGKSYPYRWNIPASVIQNWITGNNNGLVFKSESEFGEP